ncbi:hypothetical protein TWF281_004783 [Arthrobotrys megalospora]
MDYSYPDLQTVPGGYMWTMGNKLRSEPIQYPTFDNPRYSNTPMALSNMGAWHQDITHRSNYNVSIGQGSDSQLVNQMAALSLAEGQTSTYPHARGHGNDVLQIKNDSPVRGGPSENNLMFLANGFSQEEMVGMRAASPMRLDDEMASTYPRELSFHGLHGAAGSNAAVFTDDACTWLEPLKEEYPPSIAELAGLEGPPTQASNTYFGEPLDDLGIPERFRQGFSQTQVPSQWTIGTSFKSVASAASYTTPASSISDHPQCRNYPEGRSRPYTSTKPGTVCDECNEVFVNIQDHKRNVHTGRKYKARCNFPGCNKVRFGRSARKARSNLYEHHQKKTSGKHLNWVQNVSCKERCTVNWEAETN